MNASVYVANIQPHNWEACFAEFIFGLRPASFHPSFQPGDIFLVRRTGKDYGVRGISAFRQEQTVIDQDDVPWEDTDYAWLLHFDPLVAEFDRPFSEEFAGTSKFSEKVQMNAMRLAGAVVQLRAREAVGYLQPLLAEKQEECQVAVPYGDASRTVADILEHLVKACSETAKEQPEEPHASVVTRAEPRVDDVVGAPINFRGFVYAPLNEAGVVLLFSKVMDDLGIIYESSPSRFPDLVARVHTVKGFEKRYIEFEYKSSNFKLHGHDPEKCDMIVCWQHDWKDCPVEVIELRELIKSLPIYSE